MAAGENGDEQFFEDALLADDGFAHLLADAAIAVVEPFDGGHVAVDARPGLRRARLFRGFDDGQLVLVVGQPGAAAAHAPAAGGDLHGEAAGFTADIWHRCWFKN